MLCCGRTQLHDFNFDFICQPAIVDLLQDEGLSMTMSPNVSILRHHFDCPHDACLSIFFYGALYSNGSHIAYSGWDTRLSSTGYCSTACVLPTILNLILLFQDVMHFSMFPYPFV